MKQQAHKSVNLRVTMDLMRWLEGEARRLDVSVSDLIRACIRERMGRIGKKA